MSQYSYGDVSIREDLWDSIKDLDPIENYITANAGRVSVTQKVHSWISDPIADTSAVTGVAEFAATSYAATNPTLLSNTTTIIEQGFRVSRTNKNSDHAAWKDEYAREKMKKMKQWGNVAERIAISGTLGSGTGTAARQTAGIVRYASTLRTTMSAVSLTSDMLNTFLGLAWDQGAEHETVLVGRLLKSRISAFTSPNVRNIDAKDAEVVGRVDVYDSDHGRVKIVKHRYANNAGLEQTMVTYIPDYVKVGFLDEPHYEDRPADGYYDAGAVVGEFTVQVSDEGAVGFYDGMK